MPDILDMVNLITISFLAACNTSQEDYKGMVEWLKHNVDPDNTVKEYMKKTSIKRAKWIRTNPNLTIDAILKEHPRLFNTLGMVSLGNTVLYTLLIFFNR